MKQKASNIYNDPEYLDNEIEIQYSVTGLVDGDHGYHVHKYGDVFDPAGWATSSHFIGTPTTRAEVGTLNNEVDAMSDSGNAAGKYNDGEASFNGVNSILGRGMIIHGTLDADPLTRAAQCVMGRVGEASATKVVDAPTILAASCTWQGDSSTLTGITHFRLDEHTQNIWVSTTVYNMPDGSFSINVQNTGDLILGGQGIFGGQTTTAQRAKVGALGDSLAWTSESGIWMHKFEDSVAKLNGENSIIGRMAHITGADPDAPLARCIIGIETDVTSPSVEPAGTAVPHVVEAVAHLRPTSVNADIALHGIVEFKELEEGAQDGPGVTVRWLIKGLTPGAHAWHVHANGHLGSTYGTDGSSAGPHFIGWYLGGRAEAGQIIDGQDIVADADGIARGQWIDRVIRLDDYNSVTGRSIVIHAGDSTAPGARVAHGVIGRVRERGTSWDVPPILSAHALLVGTGATSPPGPTSISGSVTITKTGASVTVDYNLQNLPAGTYTWHVHDFGDVSSMDGTGTGGHFVGSGAVRGSGLCQEVGLWNDGAAMTVASQNHSGSFTDSQVTLNGVNSVVGRAIIVHNDAGARVAQGVIGIASEDATYEPAGAHTQSPTLPPSAAPTDTPNPTRMVTKSGANNLAASGCFLLVFTLAVLVLF